MLADWLAGDKLKALRLPLYSRPNTFNFAIRLERAEYVGIRSNIMTNGKGNLVWLKGFIGSLKSCPNDIRKL